MRLLHWIPEVIQSSSQKVISVFIVIIYPHTCKHCDMSTSENLYVVRSE